MKSRYVLLAVALTLLSCGEALLPGDDDDDTGLVDGDDDGSQGDDDGLEEGADAFPQDRVIEVVIELEPGGWQSILDAPEAEEYQRGAIIYDGERLDDVAVRTKGNSSLNAVASTPGAVRFPFKVDTNRYVDGQKLRGVKKLNFNNGFKDPSLIREHLGYRLAREMGLPAPRTAFADLTVAGVHLGLYTVVEHVDDDFVELRFDDEDGDLYKPDFPAGSLSWRGEDFADYQGVELKTNEDTSDHSDFLRLVDVLAHGDDAEVASVLDVEEVLHYIALNTLLVNLDSYTGNGHNYYLYASSGRFHLIPWDLNEAFANFTCGCDRAGLIGLMMDEPTCAPLNARPVVGRLLTQDQYLARYHEILSEVLDSLFTPDGMARWTHEAADLVRATVQADTTKFFSTEAFETNLESDVNNALGLISFVTERASALREQLQGISPAADQGEGSCSGGGPGGGGGGPRGGGGGPGGGGGGPGGGPLCPDQVCDQFEQSNCGACPQDCEEDATWLSNCG